MTSSVWAISALARKTKRGNFSDTSSLKLLGTEGSMGRASTVFGPANPLSHVGGLQCVCL